MEPRISRTTSSTSQGGAELRTTTCQKIASKSAQERLAHVLVDQRIQGFETFSAWAPVVCLTESTKPAVASLIADRRYEPCGIAFSKQFVFERNGGPALYVRGDEWPSVDVLPQPLRSRAVRFWPGASPSPGEPALPRYLSVESQWLQEREWRVPGDLEFVWGDVAFLIVPDVRWQSFYADWIHSWAGDIFAAAFANIPAVVFSEVGQLVHDGRGIWV